MALQALRAAACATAAVAASLLLAASAQAVQQGTTPEGRAYVSGGVSDSEQSALQSQRANFSLWIVTAAKKTGAYLSDVTVKITDSQQHVVFDAPLDGPWLLIDLPLGRYSVEARLNGEVQQQVTTIHAGDHHQELFYFGVDADVAPPAAEERASGNAR